MAFAGSLLLIVLGGAAALLIDNRVWQTITAPRPRPLADDVLAVSGRTIDASVTACALVALAGVIAILATRGIARLVVSVVVALAGVLIAWRAVAGFAVITASHARNLVVDKHSGVGLDPSRPLHVAVHDVWPALTVICGVAIVTGAVLVAVFGKRWAGMSSRYEAPSSGSTRDPTATDASLWSALDRGIDPTGEPPASGSEPNAG